MYGFSRNQQREELPDLVWVYGASPMLAHRLEKMLEGRAWRVYRGHDPPDGADLSAVIYAPGEEDARGVHAGVKRLIGLAPGVPVVVFGWAPDLGLARRALGAGARGFVHAAMGREQISRAISVVVRGEVVVPRDLLECLVAADPKADIHELRPRQLQVLVLVAEGLSNAQIAQRLFLAESTVKQHLTATYKALGVSNRNEAARLFRSATAE